VTLPLLLLGRWRRQVAMPKERMFTRIVALLALAAGLATISTASAEELVDTGLDFNVGPAAAVDDAPNSQDNVLTP
jgi:hypothetical protein